MFYSARTSIREGCYNLLMDKKLRNYIEYIKKASDKPSRELIEYHEKMLAQFQHERLVHLIVTMFFALFMIIFFIFFGVIQVLGPANIWMTIIGYCVGAVTLIFLIVTLFYVRHYYLLENGVQELEEVTRKLYKRDK